MSNYFVAFHLKLKLSFTCMHAHAYRAVTTGVSALGRDQKTIFKKFLEAPPTPPASWDPPSL